jgi:hypothetical protein
MSFLDGMIIRRGCRFVKGGTAPFVSKSKDTKIKRIEEKEIDYENIYDIGYLISANHALGRKTDPIF